MKLQLNQLDDALLIHSWTQHGDGYRIRVGENWYQQPIIIAGGGVQPWQADPKNLTTNDFTNLAKLLATDDAPAWDTGILIIGTGNKTTFPNPSETQPIMQARIGMETMTTPAACRTYNILIADGRRVVAALMV